MIRLDSYSVGSAVFGPFGAGASITGNLIIEKIVSNVDNQADWRYLHIPLQNVAISEVNEGWRLMAFTPMGTLELTNCQQGLSFQPTPTQRGITMRLEEGLQMDGQLRQMLPTSFHPFRAGSFTLAELLAVEQRALIR